MPFAPAAARASAAGFTPPVFAGGATSDVDDDAMPVFSPIIFSPADDGSEGPPLADLENQMSGEVAARDLSSPRAPQANPRAPSRRAAGLSGDEDDAGADASTPALDDLVQRLPSEVRETLEELLRVKFIRAKKIPQHALQSPRTKPKES